MYIVITYTTLVLTTVSRLTWVSRYPWFLSPLVAEENLW